MKDTLPERTASPAELARDSARMIPCECGARAGSTCDGKGGMHLVRYAAARSLGLLTDTEMTAVLNAAGDVFTGRTLIRDGAR